MVVTVPDAEPNMQPVEIRTWPASLCGEPRDLSGGTRDFGAFPDPAGPFPHIISRNLRPDNSGLPVGGDSFDKFLQTIRTGVDPDVVHPTCAGPPDKPAFRRRSKASSSKLCRGPRLP